MTNPPTAAMEEAERLLPCVGEMMLIVKCRWQMDGGGNPVFDHQNGCPADFRKNVAQALASRDDRIAELMSALAQSHRAMKRALSVFRTQGESVRPGAITGALDDAIAAAGDALAKTGEKG